MRADDVPQLFRVIVPVTDIERAERFYGQLLGTPGTRVSPGRHYFDCRGTILACFDPRADTDPFELGPNPDHLYFAVRDLEAVHGRAVALRATIQDPIDVQPWGERSFYMTDPFGNKLCFVDARTKFTGRGGRRTAGPPGSRASPRSPRRARPRGRSPGRSGRRSRRTAARDSTP